MARTTMLVFDEYVHGTSAAYSSAFVSLLMGDLERAALQVVVAAITDVASVSVQIETSSDGRAWKTKNASAEVTSDSSMAMQTERVFYGYDFGVAGAAAMSRLVVTLTGASDVTAHVKVYITARPGRPILPMPDCAFWLRADLGVTTVNSGGTDGVSLWRDQSGKGRDVGQTTVGYRPVYYGSGGSNDTAYFQLDGTDDMLNFGTSFAQRVPFTLYTVLKPEGAGGTYQALMDRTSSSAPALYVPLMSGPVGAYWNGDLATVSRSTSWHILRLRITTALVGGRVNLGAETTSATRRARSQIGTESLATRPARRISMRSSRR
jgi:hypothetical protein